MVPAVVTNARMPPGFSLSSALDEKVVVNATLAATFRPFVDAGTDERWISCRCRTVRRVRWRSRGRRCC